MEVYVAPAMACPSIQGIDFRVALRLLSFGLHARGLQPLREVLLDGFNTPNIAAKQFDRGRKFPAFHGIMHSLVADIEPDFQVLRGQKPKAN